MRRRKQPRTYGEILSYLIKEIDKLKPRKSFRKLSRTGALFSQQYRCKNCYNSLYIGEFLIVEFDHADGNRSNSSSNNCRALCPNCHAYLTKRRKKYGF